MSNEENPATKRVIITIATDTGPVDVPAIVHDNCNGLAVTMSGFGWFVVTHKETGLRMSDHYERASSALLVLSQFALIAKEHNLSWDESSQEVVGKLMIGLSDEPVPFDGATISNSKGERKQTIKEWVQNLRSMNIGGFVDEFPWEESCNWDKAFTNLAACEA